MPARRELTEAEREQVRRRLAANLAVLHGQMIGVTEAEVLDALRDGDAANDGSKTSTPAARICLDANTLAAGPASPGGASGGVVTAVLEGRGHRTVPGHSRDVLPGWAFLVVIRPPWTDSAATTIAVGIPGCVMVW